MLLFVFDSDEGIMQVAAYYRVSTDGQSIDSQRQAVREWASGQGYDPACLIEYSDHGISGAAPAKARAGFSDLLDAIRDRRVSRVIMFEASRASRDFLSMLQFMQLCQQQGVSVELVGVGVQRFESAADKLQAAIGAFLGEAERERIRERVRSGLAQARQRGVKLGRRPGHTSNKGWRKPVEAALEAKIGAMASTGMSDREIAAALSTLPGCSPISASTVGRIRRRLKSQPSETTA